MENQHKKNPWRGLESYCEGEILYGRDEDIRDLSQNVLNDKDTLLYGKSGIGKSSILNAGILPAARRNGFLPVLVRLSHKQNVARPYLVQIKNAIASAILPISTDESGNQISLSAGEQEIRNIELARRIRSVVACKDAEKESLYEFFHRHTFHNEDESRIKLLVIFDQFEEIFTLQEDETKKKQFFSELADFLNDVMPNELQQESAIVEDVPEEVRIADIHNLDDLFDNLDLDNQEILTEYVNDNEVHFVFTIREDFLSEFEYYSSSIPSLKQNRYGLRPINEEQAAQIIMRPQPGLIDITVAKLIIEKVTNRTDFALDGKAEIEVDAAVLSLYLNRLFEAKTTDTITAELVEQKGGEIITDFYYDAISDISESSVEYLENMLLNGKGRRDNITIYDATHEGNVTEKELELLCNQKKILRQFNYAGDLRIEYIHDILCPVVKAHKDERILRIQQEEEIQRQEQLLQEEKAKRERIEKKAREEKVRLEREADLARRHNRRKMMAAISLVIFLLSGIAVYWWSYILVRESYYSDFERVDGYPRGIGRELSLEERSRTPLYYRLSHKGRLNHDTDVEILSSNGVLPRRVRLSGFEINEDDVDDEKAMAYYELLSKVTHLHFIEGENKKIEKEVALDEEGNILFLISYFHIPNESAAWARYITEEGREIQIRDNGIDRFKLTWYNDEKILDPNNGRIETIAYYDANGIGFPVNHGVCSFVMKYPAPDILMQYELDHFGRMKQDSFNVITTKRAGDTLDISYGKALSPDDTVIQQSVGPKGYYREVSVHNRTDFYGMDSSTPIAYMQTTCDARGNKTEEMVIGEQPIPYPTKIVYTYESGFLVGMECFDAENQPYASAKDNIYKKRWDYAKDGKLILEEHWDASNRKIFSHTIMKKDNVSIEVLDDIRADVYLMQIDSILAEGRSTSFFGRDGKPMVHSVKDRDEELSYHRIHVKGDPKKKRESYYYTIVDGKIVPCPTTRDLYGAATSFYRKEEEFDKGNRISYRLYDEHGGIIKSMMFIYHNGQEVARAVMGIDGYGHPVRCPDWEREGFAYYKMLTNLTFEGTHYGHLEAVNEWDEPSIFFDPSKNEYIKLLYSDFYGKIVNLEGSTVEITSHFNNNQFIKDRNISDTAVPYLHILSKESAYYKEGLRDGDRIIRFGTWRIGISNTLLNLEWKDALKRDKEIRVLRPTESGFQEISIKKRRLDKAHEEYHFLRLTREEEEKYNSYLHN